MGTYSLAARLPPFPLPGAAPMVFTSQPCLWGVRLLPDPWQLPPLPTEGLSGLPPACLWAAHTLLELSQGSFSGQDGGENGGAKETGLCSAFLPPKLSCARYFRGADALPRPTGTVSPLLALTPGSPGQYSLLSAEAAIRSPLRL